jgi:hypothetical protein
MEYPRVLTIVKSQPPANKGNEKAICAHDVAGKELITVFEVTSRSIKKQNCRIPTRNPKLH